MKIKRNLFSIKKSNFTLLYAFILFFIMLFGFNSEVMESSVVFKNLVIPYIEINITVVLALLSLGIIVLLLFFDKNKVDIIMLLLLARIPLYFIPCLYVEGNFRIGIAYAVVQCAFSYFIGYRYKGEFDKIIKLLLVFSFAVSFEVFAVLIINNISIFSSSLKWYMVIPMGKSNFISCILLPIFIIVDNYYKDTKYKILLYLYTIFMSVSVLATGSKLALVLLVMYLGFKVVKALCTNRKMNRRTFTRNAVLAFAVIVGVVAVMFAMQEQVGIIIKKFVENDIFENRLYVYKDTLALISDNVLLGRGAYSYQVFDAVKAHNFILESLVQTGLIGTSIYLFTLYFCYKKINKQSDSKAKQAVLAFMTMYLLQGMAEPNLFGAISDSFFWLIIGIGCSRRIYNEKGEALHE